MKIFARKNTHGMAATFPGKVAPGLRNPAYAYAAGAVVVALLLARWSWILLAPHAISVFPGKPETVGNHADGLFGVASNAVSLAAGGQAALGNVQLLGVFSGKHGFAVLQLGGQEQRGVALGEELVKGSKLVEVEADHVIIEHNGTRQRINLENNAGASNGLIVEHAARDLTAEQAAADWQQVQQTMQQQHAPGISR